KRSVIVSGGKQTTLTALRWSVLLLPPPLRGRVRVGGEERLRLRNCLCPPHPNPPPRRGEGNKSPQPGINCCSRRAPPSTGRPRRWGGRCASPAQWKGRR